MMPAASASRSLMSIPVSARTMPLSDPIDYEPVFDVFVVDCWWNSAREDQCINRVVRLGQTASVCRVRKFVVRQVSGLVARRIVCGLRPGEEVPVTISARYLNGAPLVGGKVLVDRVTQLTTDDAGKATFTWSEEEGIRPLSLWIPVSVQVPA